MWLDVVLVFAVAAVITWAVFFGPRERSFADLDDDEPTVVDRPTLNPDNVPFVRALYAASAGIEASSLRIAGGLRDIARALQLESKRADPKLQNRVADHVQEFSSDLGREAIRIREA